MSKQAYLLNQDITNFLREKTRTGSTFTQEDIAYINSGGRRSSFALCDTLAKSEEAPSRMSTRSRPTGPSPTGQQQPRPGDNSASGSNAPAEWMDSGDRGVIFAELLKLSVVNLSPGVYE